MKRKIIVLGAGGFAREVKWLIQDIERTNNSASFAGYVVSDLARVGAHDSREEIRGDLEWLVQAKSEFDALAIGIGNPQVRLQLAHQLQTEFSPEWWVPLVHPTVQMDFDSCSIAHGVVLCAGNIATVNVVFEPYCMVNLNCTIGHEAIIGAGSVINPGTNISGGVVLEEGVLVGTGAQILQYVQVGKGAVVGAGAVVTKDVAPYETVVGIPARPLRREGDQ